MVVGDQTSGNVRLGERVTNTQRNPTAVQGPVGRRTAQGVGQFRVRIVDVGGRQCRGVYRRARRALIHGEASIDD